MPLDVDRASVRLRARLLARALGALAVVLLLMPLTVLAHPGDGIDAGQARMTARSQGHAASVTLEVLSPRPCPGFAGQAVLATRAELTVSGGLVPDGECRFSGTVQLPEQGKWVVTFAMLIDGQRSQVELPLSVTDEEQEFLREDWLHIDAAAIATPKQSTLEQMQRAIPGGVASVGIAVGVLALGAWFWRGRRGRPAGSP